MSRRASCAHAEAEQAELEEEFLEMSEEDLLQFLDSQKPPLQVGLISLLFSVRACCKAACSAGLLQAVF